MNANLSELSDIELSVFLVAVILVGLILTGINRLVSGRKRD